MFGNRTGWIIAAVVAALLSFGVYVFASLDQISKPSVGAIARTKGAPALDLARRPEMLEELKLPYDPTSVVPSMTKSGDAGPLYRRAIEAYEQSTADYGESSANKSDRLEDYPAIKLLVEAKDFTSMRLFVEHPEEVITHRNLEPKPVRAITAVGYRASLLALGLLRGKDAPGKGERKGEALAMAEAAFSLGTKMCQERVRWTEFDDGYQLVSRAGAVIAEIEPSRAAAAKAAADGLQQIMRERGMPLAHAFTSIDPEVMGRTAGDMFYIVKNSKERVWRIEAMLKLGQYKFNTGEPGKAADQRWAKLIARRVMNDPGEDPLVKLAAKETYELKMEDYMRIGNN